MQQTYVQGVEEEEDEDLVVETNHLFIVDGLPMFLTEDEEYTEILDTPKDEDYILESDDDFETKSDDYQRGYMNALSA